MLTYDPSLQNSVQTAFGAKTIRRHAAAARLKSVLVATSILLLGACAALAAS
jgi:hypothetical protein